MSDCSACKPVFTGITDGQRIRAPYVVAALAFLLMALFLGLPARASAGPIGLAPTPTDEPTPPPPCLDGDLDGFVPSALAVRPKPVAVTAELQVPPEQSALMKQWALLLLQIPMSAEFTFMQNECVSSRPNTPLVGSGQGRFAEPGTQKPEIGQLPLHSPQGAPG